MLIGLIKIGTSLVFRWLGPHAAAAGAQVVSAQGVKILHAAWCGQKKIKRISKDIPKLF